MAKLISLKLKPKNKLRGSLSTELPEEPMNEGPAYPWGTEINLETETIDKLGIDVENTKAGDMVYIEARAEVTSVSQRQTIKRKRSPSGENLNKSLSLQLTDMKLSGSKD